jgi:hypothetical protein
MAHREFVIGLNNKKGDGEGFFPVESFVRSQRMRPEQVSLLRPKAKVHCPSFVLGWGSARLCRVSSHRFRAYYFTRPFKGPTQGTSGKK